MTRPFHHFQLEWQSPGGLLPYTRRIKAHPSAQLQNLAQSIAAFGLDQLLVADAYGVLIKGHARREAAMLLGLSAVPVLVRRDLAAHQVRAARIADNQCAQSDWHWNALKAELQELGAHNAAATGFGPDELESLLYGDPPDVVFPEYDERVCQQGLCTCPHCGRRFVR